jgi:4-hydroxy-tetrahydrodipicolinate synthase
MLRGADGAMTGFAYPEMMAQVIAAHNAGNIEHARDIFDAYMPVVRYEAQPGLGLAIRKYTLAQRGVIAHATLRKPGISLTATCKAEVDALAARQTQRLSSLIN